MHSSAVFSTMPSMNFLLIFVLPLIFLLYSVFSKDTSGTFSAFILGLISGTVSLIIVSFLGIGNWATSPALIVQTERFFLHYFLLHGIFGLSIFFLLSFSFSGEVLDTSFSALFGIFSAVFAHAFYKNINIPCIGELVLFILIIAGAIFIFDFVFNILIASLTVSLDFIIYLIAFVPFLLVSLLGSFALALWYLSGSPAVYLSISIGIFVAGTVLNAVVSRL